MTIWGNILFLVTLPSQPAQATSPSAYASMCILHTIIREILHPFHFPLRLSLKQLINQSYFIDRIFFIHGERNRTIKEEEFIGFSRRKIGMIHILLQYRFQLCFASCFGLSLGIFCFT